MRIPSAAGCGRACLATIACLSVVVWAADAFAWSRFHDHVYADSFGNLVVQSPSGFKRIVVGQGYLAKDFAQYERTGEPDVVYLQDEDLGRLELFRDCFRPPYQWKGRSFMYGLPDGVIPQAPCADRR